MKLVEKGRGAWMKGAGQRRRRPGEEFGKEEDIKHGGNKPAATARN